MILDIIVFVIVSSLLMYQGFSIIKLRNKNLELISELSQAIIDINILKIKFSSDQNVEKDHLISFLSDTREIAYNYIDSIQEKIKVFIDDLEPDIIFFQEFGSLTQEYPNHKSMKKIVDHYEILKQFLPQETKND